MKKRTYVYLWLLSFGIYFLIVPLRGYWLGGRWAEIIHSVAFTILTWWALTKYAPKAGFWRVLLPMLAPWLMELVSRLFLESSILSLPITIFPLLAVVTTALFYRYRKKWIIVLGAARWLFGVIEGENHWFEWIKYGDKPVMTVYLGDCEVKDSIGSHKLSEIDAEYLVLDIWYSQCGVCLREMPEVEALRKEYKDKLNVEVASLFAILMKGETVDDGYRIMKDIGCEVPVYGIDKDSPILKKCDIQKYPRVLILDKERKVIFNGSLEFAKRKLKELIIDS